MSSKFGSLMKAQVQSKIGSKATPVPASSKAIGLGAESEPAKPKPLQSSWDIYLK